MKKIVFRMTAVMAVMTMALTANAQEPQDSIEYVNMMQELQEVVVKGNLPNTRLKGNAMITRIQGTPLSDAGALGEMLMKVPGMTGTDESPEVLGKGSPLIYINGRLMRDNGELKRLRSEEIRDVEVINNPGAQYDATVRAVVRIRTVRQQGDGLSLNLTLSDEHDLRYDFDRPQAKVGANYRKNGVDVFGSVYYYHQDYRQYSTIEDITTTDKVFRQYGPYTMTWKHDNLTYTAGVNWQLSDNHSLGVRADLTQQMNGKNQVIYDEDVFENNALIDHLYSHQTSKETKPLGWLTNTYYNGKVGKLGIDINFDFMRNGTDTDRENVEQSKVQDDFVLSKSGTRSRLYAGKLVLSYPVWKGELEAGTEMTFVNRNNTYWIDKSIIANSDADITENNVAAFAEYSCDFQKYGSASVGLRYEHTLLDYDDVMNKNEKMHRSMDEWFPTASYSVTLGKVQTALSYSMKTYRPSFFAMNDAVTYISRYMYQAGNSQLLNERVRDLTLNVSYKWITLTASYEHLTNPITQWNFLTETDAMLCKHINLDKPINTLSAYLALTPRVGIWSLNATAGFEKQDLYLDVEGPQGVYRVYYDKPQYTLNAYNTFTLKHGWKFDVNLMYHSSGCSYVFYNNTYDLRMGLVAQKNLLKDNSLTLRAAVLDCFQHNRMNEFSDCGYNQIQQNNRYSTHKLMLSLIYRLNATRSKYKGTGAGKETQARMGS
ncbi:MAG: outer membrane beta-barrel protein [Prevotella sp.]|nr:outer membrane beta-barrel protein [Prevotella sp.]